MRPGFYDFLASLRDIQLERETGKKRYQEDERKMQTKNDIKKELTKERKKDTQLERAT